MNIRNSRNLIYLFRAISVVILLAVVFMFVIPLNSFAAPSFNKKSTNVCDDEKNEVNYRETNSHINMSINSFMTTSYESKINNVCKNENGKKSSRRSDACSNGQCPVSFCYPIIIALPCNCQIYLDKVNTIPMIKNWTIVSPAYSIFKPPKKSLA